MLSKESKSVLRFFYSYPYEKALLELVGRKLTKKHSELCLKTARTAQKIWNKHEKDILDLFREMYRIEIWEKFIKVYVSLILPNSFSNPMTISFRHRKDVDKNPRTKRGFIYTAIHELAHYFAYTRNEQFFNKLYDKIQKVNLLKEHGANLHYLIQAVELGIVGEVFGPGYARYSLNWKIENRKDTEYGKSAMLLREHKVPLNKTCLGYIDAKILK